MDSNEESIFDLWTRRITQMNDGDREECLVAVGRLLIQYLPMQYWNPVVFPLLYCTNMLSEGKALSQKEVYELVKKIQFERLSKKRARTRAGDLIMGLLVKVGEVDAKSIHSKLSIMMGKNSIDQALKELREDGLIEFRRVGKKIYYSGTPAILPTF